MSRLLVEIGVENLPASYVAPAVKQLCAGVADLLARLRLDHGTIGGAATLRRLVVRVEGVADRQRAAEEIVTGPPVSRAFQDDGSPTKAAEGFARSRGIEVGALERVDTPRGEYLGVRTRLPRRAAGTVLRAELPAVIGSIRFARTMKWEPSGARFARPVRWIVAMLGARVLRFRFADVTSGNRTWAKLWMRGQSIALRSAVSWESAMQKLGVVPDAAVRRHRIETMAARAAARNELFVVEDADLFEELTYMSEDPRPLSGAFDPMYLKLPREVVTTAMRSHQRYVAVQDARGRLAPRFITFTDGKVGAPSVVRRGNERVLWARLEDASFYWREDVARGVDRLADELDRIVFIERLGTIGQKARRIETLALAANGYTAESKRHPDGMVRRAARLCKCDLASEMIKDGKEFTRLRGVIGSYYARHAGEAREVVTAIRDHYRPRTPDERVPRSHLACLIGVADRIDTICGCFLAGLKPSGSQDPYALRRAANGLLRLLDGEPGVRLDVLIDTALAAYRKTADPDPEKGAPGDNALSDAGVRDEVVEFLRARVDGYLRDHRVPYDVAAAVSAVRWPRPGLARRQGAEMTRRRHDTVFERLVTGAKRVGNILGPDQRVAGAGWPAIEAALGASSQELPAGRPGALARVRADLFADDAEGMLYRTVRSSLADLRAAEGDRSFADTLTVLSRLSGPIDAFFDAVLVNCDDQPVRRNRHALLGAIHAVFSRYADFSRIVEGPAD